MCLLILEFLVSVCLSVHTIYHLTLQDAFTIFTINTFIFSYLFNLSF